MDSVVSKAVLCASKLHPGVDATRLREIGIIVFDMIRQPGFVIDLDLVWKAAGYSKKANALRCLTGSQAKKRDKAEFQETIDFIVVQPEYTPIQSNVVLVGKRPDKIMMTADTFYKFLMRAPGGQGAAVRDFVVVLTHAVDDWFAGFQELKRAAPVDTSFAVKRIKTSESVKAHINELREKNVPKCTYAMVNGMTNRTVMGMSRSELAYELNLPKDSVNCRDHMSHEQLSATELIETLSRKKIQENKSGESVIAVHGAVCRLMGPVSALLRGTHMKEGKTLSDARIECESPYAIAAPPTATLEVAPLNNGTTNTINNYFFAPGATQNSS